MPCHNKGLGVKYSNEETYLSIDIGVVVVSGCGTVHGPISGKKYSSDLALFDESTKNPDECYQHYYYVSKRDDFVKECREYLIGKHPEWSSEIKQMILDSKYAIDFNSSQLLTALGSPQDTNRTVTGNTVREQWVYNNHSRYDLHSTSRFYIYLVNDVVTSYQD